MRLIHRRHKAEIESLMEQSEKIKVQDGRGTKRRCISPIQEDPNEDFTFQLSEKEKKIAELEEELVQLKTQVFSHLHYSFISFIRDSNQQRNLFVVLI